MIYKSTFLINVFLIISAQCVLTPKKTNTAIQSNIDRVIFDDTTGLMVFEYDKWFKKYVTKYTNLNVNNCEIEGCFYPEEIFVVDSIKILPSKVKKNQEIKWDNFIIDTSLLSRETKAPSNLMTYIEVIFHVKKIIQGDQIQYQSFEDTMKILFLNKSGTPIITGGSIHLSESCFQKYLSFYNAKQDNIAK